MSDLVKTKECIKCKYFFECDGKPKDVERCINFKERKVNKVGN